MKPDWRDLLGDYLMAVNVVSSVGIEHPEWSEALRRKLIQRVWEERLKASRRSGESRRAVATALQPPGSRDVRPLGGRPDSRAAATQREGSP